MAAMWRSPAAWIPIVLSIAALALIAGYVTAVGGARSADEGWAARVFQVLVLASVGTIVAFAIRYLPVAPAAAARVLGVQIVVAAIPIVTILVLER